jgi:hypothetical protein
MLDSVTKDGQEDGLSDQRLRDSSSRNQAVREVFDLIPVVIRSFNVT